MYGNDYYFFNGVVCGNAGMITRWSGAVQFRATATKWAYGNLRSGNQRIRYLLDYHFITRLFRVLAVDSCVHGCVPIQPCSSIMSLSPS